MVPICILILLYFLENKSCIHLGRLLNKSKSPWELISKEVRLILFRDHLSGTNAKFSEKLYQGVSNVSYSENSMYVLNA